MVISATLSQEGFIVWRLSCVLLSTSKAVSVMLQELCVWFVYYQVLVYSVCDLIQAPSLSQVISVTQWLFFHVQISLLFIPVIALCLYSLCLPSINFNGDWW